MPLLFEPLETFTDPEGIEWEVRPLPVDDVKYAIMFIEHSRGMGKDKVKEDKARPKPKGKSKAKEEELVVDGTLGNPVLFNDMLPLTDTLIDKSIRIKDSPEDEENPKLLPQRYRSFIKRLDLTAKIIKATTDMDLDINFQKVVAKEEPKASKKS